MFGKDIDEEILAAAKLTDEEICGYITDNTVVFCENISDNPKEEFRIAEVPDTAQAIFHSHPGGPFYPTKIDIQQQYVTAVPWAVACTSDRHNEVFWFGDGVPMAPLIGRGFRHYVTDCYALIRDFYKHVHDIELMDQPREWEWWNDGENLYEEGYREAGFTDIGLAELLPGDSFLATIRSKTPNHAGVYLGDGLILHHTCGKSGYDPFKLSTVEPAARWLPYLTKVLRYENSDIDRTVGQKIWPQVRS